MCKSIIIKTTLPFLPSATANYADYYYRYSWLKTSLFFASSDIFFIKLALMFIVKF